MCNRCKHSSYYHSLLLLDSLQMLVIFKIFYTENFLQRKTTNHYLFYVQQMLNKRSQKRKGKNAKLSKCFEYRSKFARSGIQTSLTYTLTCTFYRNFRKRNVQFYANLFNLLNCQNKAYCIKNHWLKNCWLIGWRKLTRDVKCVQFECSMDRRRLFDKLYMLSEIISRWKSFNSTKRTKQSSFIETRGFHVQK